MPASGNDHVTSSATINIAGGKLFDVLLLFFADNEYVGPPDCRAEMHAGRVACCPLVSHGEYADGTDRQTDRRTDARYITLFVSLIRFLGAAHISLD